MKRYLSLACALSLLCSLAWALTVDEVQQKTGIAGGLCALPRLAAGDVPLAMELAGRPTFVVHALSADAQAAARLAQAGEAAGTLGRSLYVESGSAAALPFADRLVDLLVVGDLRDADLTPQLRSEWLRVVAPRRGAALLGRAASAGAGLSREALQAWIQNVPQAQIVADASGLWAVLRSELPAGSDSWTHRAHAADNTQVSSDSTLKAPFLTQWWGMPRQEGFWGTTVVADRGRMFSLRSSRNKDETVYLTARSLTSGVVLWHHALRQAPDGMKVPHGGYIPGRSAMVIEGDTLLLIDRERVLRLDAETGADRGHIAGPKPEGQVKWIAASKGRLAVLAGEPDQVTPIAYQTVSGNPVGRELAVYDIASGRCAWHQTLGGDVDERLIAIRDDRIYALVQGQAVTCLDLASGKTVWSNHDAELQSEFQTPPSKVVAQLLFSQPVLAALEEVVVLRAKWSKSTVALSRDDGKLLWKKPVMRGSYRALTAVTTNGLLIGGDVTMDLKTGEPAKGPKFISSGCGPTTAMPGYLITCFGAVADMQSGQLVRGEDIKSPCDVGSLVAEGLLVTVPSECGCNYEVKGYRALAGAGAFRPHAAPAVADRLQTADPTPPAKLALTTADWPTYRHDPQRSGATAAHIGGAAKILWQWKPAVVTPYAETSAAVGPRLSGDFLPTAPVAAAGYVWFAGHDGVIRCLQAESGKEVWRFATGGMLFAPPSVSDGRLLAGGGDGRIYCLEATTGRLLWKFQAAPAERRVMWYGHLINTWPVVSGVVVHDGVAYSVAGYQKENGIHAYALDAVTGKVLWEQDEAGSGGKGGAKAGYSNDGNVALGGGKLWLCSATGVPGAFDLASGAWKPGSGGQFASEICVLGDKWVVTGGRRLSETQDTLLKALGNSGFTAATLDGKPAPNPLTDAGTTPPVADAELAALPPRGLNGRVMAVAIGQVHERLAQQPPAPKKDASGRFIFPRSRGIDWSEQKQWATDDVVPIAMALAQDQLVLACKPVQGHDYQAQGYSRTDGAKRWSVVLPEQPVMNRLAVDRDGHVLVSLCDGTLLCLGR